MINTNIYYILVCCVFLYVFAMHYSVETFTGLSDCSSLLATPFQSVIQIGENYFQAGVYEDTSMRGTLRERSNYEMCIMVANMCGYKCKNYVRQPPIDINSIQSDLYSDIFDDRPGTLAHWIKTISFGTLEFSRENKVHDQVVTIEERNCFCTSDCRPPREIAWLNQLSRIMGLQRQRRLLIVPSEVHVGSGGLHAGVADSNGYNGAISKGFNVGVIMHELGHVFNQDHSESACREVFTTAKPCPVSSKGLTYYRNPEGDMTCILGYSSARLFNVVIAHRLGFVTPISIFIADNHRNQMFMFTIPAYELHNTNHIIFASTLERTRFEPYIFISYRKKRDTRFHNGFYDLPPEYAGKVYVHYTAGGTDTSLCIAGIGNNESKHIPKLANMTTSEGLLTTPLTVTCVEAKDTEAIVKVQLH